MARLQQQRRMDTLVGAPLCALLNVLVRVLDVLLRRDPSLKTPPRRILVIKLVGLGSIIHATHLLQALRERYPDSHLAFLCFRSTRALVERLPQVDEVLTLDDSTYGRLLITVLRWLAHVWRHPYQLVIDLEVHSKFSTILSTLTCARSRAGFYLITTRFRQGIYTHLVYENRLRHTQEAYRQLGRALGLTVKVGQPLPPRLTQQERDEANAFLESEGADGKKLLIVNVNAGELCLERRWSPESFARVIEVFASRDDVLVVMTGAPSERDYTESVRRLIDASLRNRVANAAGLHTFGAFLALLERADAMLTNDSGPLHLATSFGTPTVSLWGPETPAAFQPLEGSYRVFCAEAYCSPCVHRVDAPPCDGNNLCLQLIEWPQVALAVAELLGVSITLPEVAPQAPHPHPWVVGMVLRASAHTQTPES